MPRSVDTNILVRLFAKDQNQQWKIASAIFEQGDVFIANTVWLECEWVLRSIFDFDRKITIGLLKALLSLEGVKCEDRNVIGSAISLYENGFDFADAMHLTLSADAKEFISFDRKLIRLAAKAGVKPPARHP